MDYSYLRTTETNDEWAYLAQNVDDASKHAWEATQTALECDLSKIAFDGVSVDSDDLVRRAAEVARKHVCMALLIGMRAGYEQGRAELARETLALVFAEE